MNEISFWTFAVASHRATERDHGVAHRREIHDARHAGEVLQQHPRRHERDLFLNVRRRIPPCHRANVVGLDERVILPPQQILEQDLHRVRKTRDARESRLFERRQAVNLDWPIEDVDFGAGTEAIQRRHDLR
jgi:hypothetical protein